MKEVKHTPELPPLPWSFAKQKGKPGHCHAAQIFDITGKAIIMIEPTEDEHQANHLVKYVAETASKLEAANQEIERLKADLMNICNYVSMREFDVSVLRQIIEQTKIDNGWSK